MRHADEKAWLILWFANAREKSRLNKSMGKFTGKSGGPSDEPRPGRTCGSCMMCCKVPYIAEFEKPPGVWCRHAVPGKGCGIYGHHPASCQAFYCLWMQDASFGPEWKPDRAKFVVYVQQNGVNLQVAVDPGFPNAWAKPPYYARIKSWAKEGADHGRFVFVRIGRRLIVVLPDCETDLGEVGVNDDILISRQPGPTGFDYEIDVKRKSLAKIPTQLATLRSG